jgi:hypothetical protein
MDYAQALRLYQADKIPQLASTVEGLKYLKLKTLSRKEHLIELLEKAGVRTTAKSVTALLKDAVTADISNDLISSTIASIYARESSVRLADEPRLVSELYKMEVFDWGGLHQNSLEKTIVDNYVKKITSFNTLEHKIENELLQSMRGFVLCQWYNHWTSIIIEDVFNSHKRVTPAVSKVKKIDFFVDDVPFDLKVTYLPEGFIQNKRRAANMKPELTLVRSLARALGVEYDSDLPPSKLLEDLIKKLRDHPNEQAVELWRDLYNYRMALLTESIRDPLELITWLYENQGIRRFDSSNRLFLVLVDTSAFFDSWKLKRAKPLLESRVRKFLDDLPATPGRDVKFAWEGTNYQCRADVCFIVPPQLGV